MIQKKLSDVIHPFEKQLEFIRIAEKTKYTLYGGAKGGGKSYILRWYLVLRLYRWFKEKKIKNIRAGLFCEDYPSLKDRQITKIATEFPLWLGTLQDSQVHGMSFMLRPEFGGGVIALRNLDDPSKYASSEFAIAAVDELTKNKRTVLDQLRSIIRWPGIENTKFVAGSNPGEIGHQWVKKLFVDREFTSEDPKPEEISYIKSLPTDNPYNAKSYIEELKRLPEKLRRAYLEGNWDVFEGQYFTEWDKEKHVVTPFIIPFTWKKFRAYDHGRKNPACCKWYALDYDGVLYAYREYYPVEKNVDEIAAEINRMSGEESYEFSVADPSIFANIGYVDKFGGQTIAETFARYGITFIPASNRRIDGWNLMHQYLKNIRIKYFSTCSNSIRTIPNLVYDKNKPEDLDTNSEDHAADTDRYMLMSIHEGATPGAIKDEFTGMMRPKNEVEKKLERMKIRDSITASQLNQLYYG